MLDQERESDVGLPRLQAEFDALFSVLCDEEKEQFGNWAARLIMEKIVRPLFPHSCVVYLWEHAADMCDFFHNCEQERNLRKLELEIADFLLAELPYTYGDDRLALLSALKKPGFSYGLLERRNELAGCSLGRSQWIQAQEISLFKPLLAGLSRISNRDKE